MRSKLPLKLLAFELAVLAGIAGLCELWIRFDAPYYAKQTFDHEYTANFPMEINADDYRGPLVPKTKVPPTYRVLALGDSITFGTGVPAAATWPHRLGAHLMSGRPVDVVNAGIEGSSLNDIKLALEKKWLAYDPDLIVLAVTGNMVSLEIIHQDKAFMPDERYASFRRQLDVTEKTKIEASRLMHKLALPSFLSLNAQNVLYWIGLLNHLVDPRNPYGAVLAHGFAQGDLDPKLAETAWTRFGEELGRLKQIADGAGKRLLVTYVAPRFTLSDERRDNAKNVPVDRFTIDPVKRFEEIAAAHGIKTVDTRAALLKRRIELEATPGVDAPMYIPFDYAHLDQEGHDALGKAFVATAHGLSAP